MGQETRPAPPLPPCESADGGRRVGGKHKATKDKTTCSQGLQMKSGSSPCAKRRPRGEATLRLPRSDPIAEADEPALRMVRAGTRQDPACPTLLPRRTRRARR